MTCLAKHAPLENLRSCAGICSRRQVQMGALQVMCTWIFLRVGACGSLPARNLYSQN